MAEMVSPESNWLFEGQYGFPQLLLIIIIIII